MRQSSNSNSFPSVDKYFCLLSEKKTNKWKTPKLIICLKICFLVIFKIFFNSKLHYKWTRIDLAWFWHHVPDQESISPTNMCKSAKIQFKMAHFTNIYNETLKSLFSITFLFHEPYFGAVLQMMWLNKKCINLLGRQKCRWKLVFWMGWESKSRT